MATSQGRSFFECEPSPRWDHFSAAVEDQLYMWGGKTERYPKEKSVLASYIHRFHPVLEYWEQLKSNSSPPALYSGACTSIESHLFIYGGLEDELSTNCLYQLDTESQKWQQISNAGPMKKSGCKMIAYGKKLFLFGGYGVSPDPLLHFFEKSSKYSISSTGWTNELHSFNLEEGECAALQLLCMSSRKVLAAVLHYISVSYKRL